MTVEEAEAFAEAEMLIAQAKREGWRVLSLEGAGVRDFTFGDETRQGAEILQHLMHLPPSLFELQDLVALNVSYTNLSAQRDRIDLPNLVHLDLSNSQIADFSPLSGLTALQSLNLAGTQVSDVSALSGLTALQSLNIAGTQVSDVSALSSLTALQILSLRNTQVSDVSALSGLTALQSLNLDGTQVSDVSALSGLTALQSLDLEDTQVSDVSALSGLTALRSLTLNNTQVSDVSALSGLSALRSLNLEGTQVSDLGVVSHLRSLELIYFDGTSACEGSPALAEISEIDDDAERLRRLRAWLEANGPPGPKDVFLSFNSAQSAHAAAIYQRLTEAGLSIHYHARDVDLGQSFLTWMNDALKVSKRTLALASPLYFSDEAPWCQVEREAVLVTDPVSEKGKLVLVEIEPYPPEPIYDRLSKVTETSGLPPEEAAEALLAALKTRDARGNVVRWAAGPKALDFHAPDLDADGLEDVAEDLAIARAAAEALADSLAADDAPADDLKAAVEACRTHLDRAPARVRVGTVSTLYLRLRDQLLGQTPPAGQPRSNVVVAERSLRQLETLFHALRTLLRTLPGGAEAEKEMLALEGGKRPDADKAISVIDAMDGDARVDQTAVAMARILVRLSDHETQAGVAAGQTLLDLAHNFEIAIGDIIQEVSRARREGSDDPIKGDYMIGFVRDNEKVLRAFAMANIPAGEIWFDTLLALINKPGMP